MSNTPNIWYVHPYAGGPGVGRYSRPYYLAQYWLAAGAKATVFTPSFHHLLDAPQHSGNQIVEGVPYEFVPSPSYQGNGLGRLRNMATFSARMYAWATKFAAQHGRPDMIVASSPHPYVFLATHAIARKFDAVSVFEVRDLWPLSLIELAGVAPTHPLVRFTEWLERRAYRQADFTVSLLPCTLDYMQGQGLAAAHWRYIPNGVHQDEFQVMDSQQACVQQVRQWRSQGRTIVTYTGALGRPNHVDSLIRAIALLRDQGDDSLAAVIVGRGELEADLQNLISQSGLSDRVALFGQIPKQDVLALLSEVDIGYISLRPEPLFRFGVSPNKLFDYMLAGLPVVFAVQAGNDPVGKSKCGISADPGNPQSVAMALHKIGMLSSAERKAMGERGRSFVLENHTYERLASRYLDLLKPLPAKGI